MEELMLIKEAIARRERELHIIAQMKYWAPENVEKYYPELLKTDTELRMLKQTIHD